MARKKTGYLGRVLIIRPVRNTVFTWTVSLAGKVRAWREPVEAQIFFIREDELQAWEEGREGPLPIPAGFWKQRKDKFRVIAPVLGYAAPFEIPPGLYHIAVRWGRSSAASEGTIRIPAPEGKSPLATEEVARISELPPDVESTRTARSLSIRYWDEESSRYGERKNIPLSVSRLRPAPALKGPRGQDQIDPFADVQSAMPLLVADIQRARTNIWIAWWALEDDFPTQFNAAGLPVRFLRDEISAALAGNPQLQVYMLIWNLNGGARRPNPALFCALGGCNRLHIRYQSNWVRGSHHQKFVLVDLEQSVDYVAGPEGAALWCRGWDGLVTYWDIHSHGDPDPFLDATGRDHQPWHDSAVRVVAKRTIGTFEREFRRRWALGGFAPPLPPAPTFVPTPNGRTRTLPMIHIEWTRPGPQESWYLGTIRRMAEGLYFENQYLDDAGVVNAIIGRYLGAEVGPRPVHGALNICHPEVQSPFFIARRSRLNIATVRAHTARWLQVRTAAGLVRVARPPGGWTTVAVRAPWPLLGGFFKVAVTAPGIGANGDMERAGAGVACITMVTPSATVPAAFRPVYLHSKFAVIDSSYMLGSCNIGLQSFARDSEADVLVPKDPVEAKRVMTTFFPNLVGAGAGGGAGNLSTWINRMERVAAANHDMELGAVPWAPVGLITEFPYKQ